MDILKHVKIQFNITQDSEGYPPVAVEGVWAMKAPCGSYVLDNIPFFTRDATFGDTVTAKEDDHA